MNVNVSDYSLSLSEELRPLINRILHAFAHRPVPPSGTVSASEIEALVTRSSLGLSSAVEALRSSLPAMLQESPGTTVSPPVAAKEAAARVSKDVDELIGTFHSVWRLRFPKELADGQPVISAMMERPLRDVLLVLENVVAAIENPEQAVNEHGSARIVFELGFNVDDEAEAVSRWAERVRQPRLRPALRQSTKGGCSWTQLAIAFAFGRWSGRE